MDLGGSPHQFGQASEDFFNTWNNVVAQLMAMNPREDIPGQAPGTRITPQDKAWLKLLPSVLSAVSPLSPPLTERPKAFSSANSAISSPPNSPQLLGSQ